MKALIKRCLPDSIVSIISNLQDEWLSFLAYARKSRAFKKKHNGGSKIRITFIVFSPQSWNSLKPVYNAAHMDDRVETKVIVLPGDFVDGGGRKMTSLAYFRKECEDAVDAYENGKLLEIKDFFPDIIFRQTPYEEFYPRKYQLPQLAKIAKVCYVPYNYNSSPEKHLKIEYGNILFRYVYAIFSECESNKNYCEQRRSQSRWYRDLRIYNLGFPRFDLYNLNSEKQEEVCREYRRFLWLPRWTMDDVNNTGSSFFEYKDELLNYFSEHREISLIIRPHPRMFSNFVKMGAMSEQDVGDLRKRIMAMDNVRLDDNFDYIETFNETDVLISDFSSLQTEFFITGKPIIYSGDSNDGEYNRETERMVKLFYSAADWEQLKYQIEELSSGKDKNKELRQVAIAEFTKGIHQNIGKSIIDECIKFA